MSRKLFTEEQQQLLRQNPYIYSTSNVADNLLQREFEAYGPRIVLLTDNWTTIQIRQSMDGKSRWADNIMIERWFRSFKYEEAYLTQYNNIREARKAIGKYVQTYNFERCHSALNNQTPASCYYPILLLDDYAA